MRVEQLEQALEDLAASQPPVGDGREGLRRRSRHRRHRRAVGLAATLAAVGAAVFVWQPWVSPRSGLDVTAGPEARTDLTAPGNSGSNPTSIIPPGTAPCRAHQLQVSNGSRGGNQTTLIDVQFTNISQVPCSLAAIPTAVRLVPSDGASLALTVVTAPDAALPAVLMQPGAPNAATLTLDWSNWCSQSPSGQLELRFSLTETGDTLTARLNGPTNAAQQHPVPTPSCLQPDQPSTLFIVHAYLGN